MCTKKNLAERENGRVEGVTDIRKMAQNPFTFFYIHADFGKK